MLFSPVVIIILIEVFKGTVPSKIIFPFPWNPYLKTDGTSLLILFLVKNFKEKEIQIIFDRTVLSKKSFKKMITTGLPSEIVDATQFCQIVWRYDQYKIKLTIL